MIVDASAICAILLKEAEGAVMAKALAANPDSLIGPIQVWEANVALSRRLQGDQSSLVDDLIQRASLSVVTIGPDEAKLAFEAWLRFGKGRHPAGLNLGGCFAYALAKSRGLPLLYKGDDFSQTDVRSALR